MPDIKPHIIIGGGIMGLAIGWRLLREGAEHVVIFESGEAARSGAAWVAAGMLSPRAEAGFEDMDIYEDGVKSLDLYPQFLDELRSDTGDLVPQLYRSGVLVLATTADEVRELDRQYDFRKRANIPVERLSSEETREREPLLSTKVKGSLWLEQEAQINNRQLCLALKEAFVKRGGTLREHCTISEIVMQHGQAIGVRFGDESMNGQSITIAAGAWSSKIGGIAPLPVRPVKGQMIGLRMTPASHLKQPIRAPRVYLVPKDDGRLLIGATAEEAGFDPRIIAGSIMELLHFAWEIVPAIYELEIEEMLANFRPATRNHRPIVGKSEIDNLYYATGHWRHGILMAPLTAYTISKIIMQNAPSHARKEGIA